MPQRIARICLLLLLAVSLASGAFTIANGWLRAHIFHQLDYVEGVILDAAVRVAEGHAPYPRPGSWPIVINNYGPTTYYIAALAVDPNNPSLTGPRLIVFGCGILCALLTGLIAVHFSQSRVAGGIAGALFLSHSLVRFWIPLLRVDFFGLLLTLAGLWVFVRFPRWWPLSVFLFAGGIFTKPTFIAAPLACVLWLLVTRDFRRAARFAATGFAICLVALVGLQLWTHSAFTFYLFRTHPDPWLFSQLLQVLHYLVFGNPILTLVAAIAFVASLVRRNFDVLTIWTALLACESLTGGKLGASDNHLLEFTAVLCILGSKALFRWASRSAAISFATGAACVLMGLWLVLQIPFAPPTSPAPGCAMAYDAIRRSPSDRILSEDVGALVLARKTVWVSDPFVFGQVANVGLWPQDEIANRIRSHWFDMILLSDEASKYTQRWTPDLLRDIRENYHLAARFPCQDANAAYIPNGGPSIPAAKTQ